MVIIINIFHVNFIFYSPDELSYCFSLFNPLCFSRKKQIFICIIFKFLKKYLFQFLFLYSLFPLTTMSNTCSTILNITGDLGHLCLVPNHREKGSSVFPLSRMLDLKLRYKHTFYNAEEVATFSYFPETLMSNNCRTK